MVASEASLETLSGNGQRAGVTNIVSNMSTGLQSQAESGISHEVVAKRDHLARLECRKGLPNVVTEHDAIMVPRLLNCQRAVRAGIHVALPAGDRVRQPGEREERQ